MSNDKQDCRAHQRLQDFRGFFGQASWRIIPIEGVWFDHRQLITQALCIHPQLGVRNRQMMNNAQISAQLPLMTVDKMASDDPAAYYQPPKMIATQEEMAQARLPLVYRDFCAHLLIPLNKCRHENFYMPWACQHELHEYEKCEYKDYKRRMLAMEKFKAAQKKKT